MVQIQFDLNEDSDKKLKIFMAYNDIRNKEEAIQIIIEQYFIIRPPKMECD